jgi:DNA polymerase-3 subunit gamma/tau
LPANAQATASRQAAAGTRVPGQPDARPEPPRRAAEAAVEHDVPPWEDLPAEAYADDDGRSARGERAPMPDDEPRRGPLTVPTATAPETRAPLVEPEPEPVHFGASGDAEALLALGDWRGLIRTLALGGLVRELAQHCEWVECADDGLQLRLSVAHRHLLDMNRGAVDRLQDLLAGALGRPLKVRIEIGDIAGETPAQRDALERRARHAEAVAALEADPFVRELIERFDATLVESTVKPV